jgi:hypothetical protein
MGDGFVPKACQERNAGAAPRRAAPTQETLSSPNRLDQQPNPYSHFFWKNSSSLAVKKWCTPSGLRTKKR